MFNINYFKVDENLMYIIQHVSKDSTADILAYFYNMALEIAEDYTERHPKHRINKKLDWKYRSTCVPFSLGVYTGYNEKFDTAVVHIQVYVKFPQKKSTVDVTEMINSIVETGLSLDGSELLPAFKEPKTRIPAGFKSILKRK